MYVCICKGVTDRQIQDEVQRGANLKTVVRNLGVGTCCGRCTRVARDVVNNALPVQVEIMDEVCAAASA